MEIVLKIYYSWVSEGNKNLPPLPNSASFRDPNRQHGSSLGKLLQVKRQGLYKVIVLRGN